jgi:hypothetical protein
MKLLPLPILGVLLVAAGCGDAPTAPPPDAAKPPVETAPKKVPTTTEEKVQAIQNSSLPEDQKKAAIEKVRSGSL